MQNKREMSTRINNGIFHTVNYLANFIFAFLCAYPFLYIFFVSISDVKAVQRGEVIFWPVKVTLYYYTQVFRVNGLVTAFFISVSRSVLGTLIQLFFTTMLAYAITKKEFKLRKVYYRLTISTMYFGAGIIPYVLTMSALGLRNNFLLYILPSAVNPFGVVLIKTYFEQLPQEIEESAIADGAGYLTVLAKIIVPISKPVIATLAIFCAVGQWNTFMDNFLLVQKPELTTLQYLLWQFMQAASGIANSIRSNPNFSLLNITPPNPFTFKCAISIITIIPILCVYPFLQRHFAGGIMIGAVKG